MSEPRTFPCPVCRQAAKRSRWTGRIKLHVGNTIGDRVFCNGRTS